MPQNGLSSSQKEPVGRGLPSVTLDVEPQTLEPYFYLRSYWNILRKRRWTVLTVTFVLATLATIYSFKVRPTFRAVGRVEVDPEATPFQVANQNSSSSDIDASFLQTQVDVLNSNDLAWETIEQLKLGTNPDFNRDLRHSGLWQTGAIARRQTQLIRLFHRSLHVDLASNSRMLAVSFDSPDPELAADVANALMKNYLEYNFTTKYDATRQAAGWMEQQLDDLKAKVEKSEQALVDYDQRNAIVDVGDKQSLAEQNLALSGKENTDARNHLAEVQSLYDLVQANPSQTALLAQDGLLQMLQEKRAGLRTHYVNALAQYGPKFPKVVRLKAQINAVQKMITEERGRCVARIRRNYDVALGREKILSREVAKSKAEVEALNHLLIHHNILKRDFETNQDLYDSLLKRLKNASVTAGLRATNIHIVDQALPPAVPVWPRKALNIAVGLAVGLLVGITLALVEEGLDTSIQNPEDLESLLPTPNLAAIPAAHSLQQRSFLSRKDGFRKSGDGHAAALVVSQRPRSAMAESFRALRTLILLPDAPQPPQVLLVTSAQPGEGKTSASVNLAMALAQQGRRVLLMDGDLRKPEIANTLGLEGAEGLSGILAGAHDLDASVQRCELMPNLWTLGAGPCPPNPSELLASAAMGRLLSDLRLRFDYLVIDSPPVLLVTDATVLAKAADGIVMVVESGVTSRGAVVRAYKTLEASGGRVLGTVVNKVDLRYAGYSGRVYKNYHRYYYQEQTSTHGALRPTTARRQDAGITSRT